MDSAEAEAKDVDNARIAREMEVSFMIGSFKLGFSGIMSAFIVNCDDFLATNAVGRNLE